MNTKIEACPFCHIVIPASDLEKARVFYSEVFGWQVQKNVPGNYYWFFKSGNVDGAFSAGTQAASGSISLVIRVDDMPATLERVTQWGGVITRARSSMGDADPGFDAYFRDPNGNEMGVYSDK
jgi:uncharacterized protein